MKILINWLIYTLAITITAYLLPGVTVAGLGVALIAAVVLGLINAVLRPLFIFFTLPLTILSLGLFVFVINALLVLLASYFVDGFMVGGFWWALLFSLIVSGVNGLFGGLVKNNK